MTTRTLRPTSTPSSVGGTITGAASWHAALNDSSDSSYVTLANGNGAILELGTYTLAADELVKYARIRARAKPSFTATATLRSELLRNSTTLALIAPLDSTLGSGGFVDFAGTYAALAMTQAEIDALAAQVYFNRTVGSSNAVVAELWAELVIASAPTVAVTGPTGTITTPQPTVAWTFTQGSDGGPQSKYRVKVFSAAQYGAGGFNPASSTPTYDSGELVGSPGSFTLPTGLANSTTWRAYVQVAHTINGLDAWSTWQYTGFSTSYALSSVSTVAGASTDGSGLITVTVTRNTGTHAWDTIDVERSDDGGSTWVPVRGATDQGATNTWLTTWGANTAVVVDYEAPNGVAVLYRARAAWDNSGFDVRGAWVSSSSVMWSAADVWLKNPLVPASNLKVAVQVFPTTSRPVARGVMQVLGRPNPVIIADVRQGRTGSAVFQTDDVTDAAAFEAVIDDPAIKLLQFPAVHLWGSKYVSFGEVTEGHGHPSVDQLWRSWTVQLDQVDAPEDDT